MQSVMKVVWWERRVHNYLAFVVIACVMTCLRAFPE